MRIVHFSDWHGIGQQLPDADLYICTGDMYDDAATGYRTPMSEQAQFYTDLDYSPFLPSRVPVVCVRGNHDMHPIGRLFNSHDVYEVQRSGSPRRVPVGGGRLTVGGFWGVRAIGPAGPSLRQDAELDKRVAALPPNLDLLVTHCPPAGLLDHDGTQGYGLQSLRAYITNSPPLLHCFGHIHEAAGPAVSFNSTVVSNAATTFNVIEMDLLQW